MPRATTLLAGLLAATAITYQSRINLVTNTANVQKQIDEAKLKADQLTTKPTDRITRLSLSRPTSSVEKFIDNSKHYYKGRLVPSVKESWNAQVAQAASAVIQSNIPTRVGHFILRNVFGHTSN